MTLARLVDLNVFAGPLQDSLAGSHIKPQSQQAGEVFWTTQARRGIREVVA